MTTTGGWFGSRVKRVEDRRFLTGSAEYLDDMDSAGALHVAIHRSVYAHARIVRVDAQAALAMPGVTEVLTAEALGTANGPIRHPLWRPNPALIAAIHPVVQPQVMTILASGKVRYVGEPVAAVVAVDAITARDAMDRIQVEYERLAPVTDAEAALADDAPLLYEDWESNLATGFTVEKGDIEAALRTADHVVRGRFRFGRQTGVPIELRGVLARPDRRSQGIVVWSSTQNPHWLRNALAAHMGLDRDQVRVIAPDVGGGFGVKSMVYPEEVLLPLLARRLATPVKWIESRSDHFLGAIHSRDHVHDIALALKADGTFLGVDDRFVANVGALSILPLVESYNTAAHVTGPYRVPALFVDGRAVVTNKSPSAPVRGAGRPEAVFAMERVIDLAARELGMDPAEIRRINTLRHDEMPYDAGMPYRDGERVVLDSGDYLGCLDHALSAIDYPGFRGRQHAEREAGRYLGIGVAGYIEGTGIGPAETADVRVDPSGHVTVSIAVPSQGQGHATTMAQIVADQLGVQLTDVRLIQGDTMGSPIGDATIASRVAVVAGNAVHIAAERTRQRALAASAELLEVAVDDLELCDGVISVVGSPDRSLRLAEVAAALENPRGRLVGWEPGLGAAGSHGPRTVTWANGVHVAVVDVDPATGQVKILRYVVVHDCGRVINPTIVDGQIAGGVVQGIGSALLEELAYDPNGQLITGSFMDYLLPSAAETPPIEVFHHESPSPLNPLGIKGVGEGGTIPVSAVIAGAVEDALSPFGIEVHECPLTPDRVWQLVAERRALDG
jgi:aerobic carbon-monoxide dehydrogenase large subunit